ncbi:hypothetical protein DUNSADRAFT_16357 [Dunaliella salina]|uniref:Protein kinase domain-containing protein n=1 Tax=Dunaliella salina TaxID=3046 RepID=A0ABQ7H128_DUNSA|nr:hypothetical protein DUNSADRAFT_16357 [Dunaliella salina]|eukprot:KAF5840559.1 hypothetical protein DUNSADRAFT_16357 [Dunaliella salina]
MNQYHIYEKIGKGKYSTCYKGRRKRTIAYYAIKSVDKSQKARVLQEVRTMHALDHKNILRFFAWYETTNHLWLILEYCVGGDLMSLLRQDVRLPESSVHDFGRDLVVALQYLHHNSIIYCDLKPSNILLDENGRLKLGGFGLSRRLSDINKTPLQSLPPPAPIPGASPQFASLCSRLLDKNPATRIKWHELIVHPFWQVCMTALSMPPEPALEAFVKAYKLAPADANPRASMASQSAARTMRQSVDVTRLSRIALSNLEREGDGSDYTAVEMQPGDVRIDTADAELDFVDERDDGAADDDEHPSPAQSDDGAVIDQGAAFGDAGQVGPIGGMALNSEQIRPGQGRGRGNEPAGSRQGGQDKALEDEGAGNDSTDVCTTLDPSTPALESLVWHASDAAVKPIVANRRIERLPEPKFDAKALPFPAMSLQEMLHAEQKELENFLTHIYRAIASAAPLKDKVNVLSYFETLCVDTNAANVLINSSLTILFIRMLRNARAPTLRIRLASVLGLLVRHATFIAEELAQTGVVEILTDALKDKMEKVRLLKPQEDEVTQHYAVKTIENICSQGGDWAANFCSNEVAFSLVQIYSATKSENLKATTASTLARLLRHNPTLVVYVVDKFGTRLFVAGLSDPNSKVVTGAINMLNMALCQPDLTVRARAALSEERSLIPALMALLDHPLPVLRAKAIVTIMLLCTRPYFRASTVTPALLSDLAFFLVSSSNPALATTSGMAEFKATLMHVLEAICQQTELVLQHHEAMLSQFLPALCATVSSPHESGDTRFFCLRMVSEIKEDLNKAGARRGSTTTPARVNGAKIPFQQFQLLGGLLESNPGYVQAMEAMGLATQFFEFLSLEHANNNVHNIRLCRQIVAAGSMPVSVLVDLQVGDKVAVYPEQCAPWLLSPESVAILAPVLQGEHLDAAAAAPPAQLQQHLLEAVSRSLQVPGSLQGPDPELLKLHEATQALAAGGPSSHPGVAALAAEVLEGLAPMVS